MPLPRFRLRSLMIAVAVIAIVIVTNDWRVRAAERTRYCQSQARYYRSVVNSVNPAATAYQERFAKEKRDMIVKYERAARYPWLAVPREQPMPQPR